MSAKRKGNLICSIGQKIHYLTLEQVVEINDMVNEWVLESMEEEEENDKS